MLIDAISEGYEKKRNKRKERIWWESVWTVSYYYAHYLIMLSQYDQYYVLCSQCIITSLCSLSYNVITLCSTLYHVVSTSSNYVHIILSLLCSYALYIVTWTLDSSYHLQSFHYKEKWSKEENGQCWEFLTAFLLMHKELGLGHHA